MSKTTYEIFSKVDSLNESNNSIDESLINFVCEVSRQSKYDNDEDAIYNIFNEIESRLETLKSEISTTQSTEDILKWLRCE